MKIFTYISFFIILFSSCSTYKNLNVGCKNLNSENYYIEKSISKKDINKLSAEEISDLKTKLISQISSSVSSKSVIFQGINEGISYEFFSKDASDVAYGYLNDPNISYCKKPNGWFVILSINKNDFISQTVEKFENELDVSIKNIYFSLNNFDTSKQTFNNQEAKKFNLRSQQLQSMHALVVNENNYNYNQIKILNDKLAQYLSLAYEFTKKSYVFDKQMSQIDNKLNNGRYKEAYLDLNILSKLYNLQSSETVQINSKIKEVVYEIENKWDYELEKFNESLRTNKITNAKIRLDNLFELVVLDGYESKYRSLFGKFKESRKKFERERLLAESPKNQEFFFGLNATSSFGNITSTDNSIFLDPETSSFNFDRIFPSYQIGYKYYFNPKKRIGISLKYKANSKKFIQLSSNLDSDYVFPFVENFNEAQLGFSFGPFDISYGKLLNKMEVNNEEVEFNTASLTMSLITTDGLEKGKRNYLNIYGGVNFISDFADLSYLNLVFGLNYHIRFNPKLSKKNRSYLSSL